MQVKEITNKEDWDNFIESVFPSTFLHTWAWGEFEESLGRKIKRVGVCENGSLIAVCLWTLIRAKRGSFILCPHGPIIKKEIKDLKPIISELLNFAKTLAKENKCDFIRVSTLIEDKEEHRKVFKDLGFRLAPIHMHSELAWILNISGTEEELLSGMKKNTRYSIKKAIKDGVEIKTSTSMDDFEKFWKIYMATANRQNFTPYSRDFLTKEFELFFKENKAVLFFAQYQGEAISTAFIVFSNGSGFYHHGASDNHFPGITASEFVQWQAILEAKRRGMTKYNFWGVVPETATKHPWFGLSKFKRGFGGYDEAYVHAQDFVLTPKYWLNYVVEKIRKIRRRL